MKDFIAICGGLGLIIIFIIGYMTGFYQGKESTNEIGMSESCIKDLLYTIENERPDKLYGYPVTWRDDNGMTIWDKKGENK